MTRKLIKRASYAKGLNTTNIKNIVEQVRAARNKRARLTMLSNRIIAIEANSAILGPRQGGPNGLCKPSEFCLRGRSAWIEEYATPRQRVPHWLPVRLHIVTALEVPPTRCPSVTSLSAIEVCTQLLHPRKLCRRMPSLRRMQTLQTYILNI